ncbi:hypothetical protein HK096_010954, partial [Nowakowskiella sp. JEL0078]
MSIDQIFTSFDSRISELHSILLLSEEIGTKEYNSFLETLKSLNNRVTKLQKSFQSQKTQLQYAKTVVLPRLHHIQMSVEYALRNVPEELKSEVESAREAEVIENHRVTLEKRPKARAARGDMREFAQSPKVMKKYIDLITEVEYSTLPKYTVGRVTIEKLNASLETLNYAFKQKDIILSTNSLKLSKEYRDILCSHKEVTTEETEGKVFVTDQDLKEFGFKMDTVGRCLFT